MKKGSATFFYTVCDLVFTALAWTLFCHVKRQLELSSHEVIFTQFVTGVLIIPPVWVFISMLAGFYRYSLKRSRLMELIYSFSLTLPFTFLIYFILLVKGIISDNSLYFKLFTVFFLFQFSFTYLPRLIITSMTAARVHRGLAGYQTLIIGSNGLALETFRKISEEKIPSGSIIQGYVSVNNEKRGSLGDRLRWLGVLDDLPEIIASNGIEEVIIAIEGNEVELTGKIIGMLNYSDVTVKAIPSLKDILTGRVEHTEIFGTPLLEVSNRLMPVWQGNLKQFSDYVFAAVCLIILSPLIAVLAVLIKLSGPGPVIYSQERIGRNGKPFTIYKLRSMNGDAEKGEPMLSSRDDSRITGIGKVLRRHRLDEIPNLVNVLKGEMSLVGPRPERQYFINKITARAPHYRRLLKVKPGITSWGQVKYGYASDVDQMVERLEYDLLYLENMSLLLDMKIIIYTTIIILNGKGI
jgi:exopolysaccharide biosynthesis polyprenyl glycosylphosphotransferase